MKITVPHCRTLWDLLGGVFLCLSLALGYFAWHEHAELDAYRGLKLGVRLAPGLQKTQYGARNSTNGQSTGTGHPKGGADRGSGNVPANKAAGLGRSDVEADKELKGDIADAWLALMNDPKVLAYTTMRQREWIESHYRNLFNQLGLNEADRERLEGLLVDKRNSALDATVSAEESGDPDRLAPAAINAAIKDYEATVDEQIKNLLGSSGFATYEGYVATLQGGDFINRIQEKLSGTQDVLTADQIQQLQTLLLQQNTTQPTWNVIQSAKQFLTPNQVAAIYAVRQDKTAAKQLQAVVQQYQQVSGSSMPLALPH